jgi:hypothetical protein
MFPHFAEAVRRETPELQALSEPFVSAARPNRTWTRKEELGHLIDSAANNHIRFARGAFEPEFHGPSYNPDAWVNTHGYQKRSWSDLVAFWSQYNLFLEELVQGIPYPQLNILCHVAKSPPMTLRFLVEDYIIHMQHHVDQILDRPNPTPYPQKT